MAFLRPDAPRFCMAVIKPAPILVHPPGWSPLTVPAILAVITFDNPMLRFAVVLKETTAAWSFDGVSPVHVVRRSPAAECSASILLVRNPGSIVLMLPDVSRTIRTSSEGLAFLPL